MAARRIVMVLMSTVTIVVLLFGYRTSTAGRPAGRTVTAASPVGTVSGPATATATGPTVQTQWGPVQVRLTIRTGRITTVDVLQQPHGNPRDEEINASALPRLETETVEAQSADIDMVSGATVTSNGYLQSLQGALDRAGL